MFQRKENNFAWNRVGLAVALVVVSLMLIVSTAWARYRTDINEELAFQPRVPAQVYIWGAKAEDGTYSELPHTWTLSSVEEQTGQQLSFVITNGTPQQEDTPAVFADEDLTVVVRLVATEGIGSGENLDLLLQPDSEEDVLYEGVAASIQEGTTLHAEFGDGWLYRFLDGDGREIQWTLPGGTLSEFSAVLLCINNGLGADPSMLQIQVIAESAG